MKETKKQKANYPNYPNNNKKKKIELFLAFHVEGKKEIACKLGLFQVLPCYVSK